MYRITLKTRHLTSYQRGLQESGWYTLDNQIYYIYITLWKIRKKLSTGCFLLPH